MNEIDFLAIIIIILYISKSKASFQLLKALNVFFPTGIEIATIASFNRIKQLSDDITLVVKAMKLCLSVEVSLEGYLNIVFLKVNVSYLYLFLFVQLYLIYICFDR